MVAADLNLGETAVPMRDPLPGPVSFRSDTTWFGARSIRLWTNTAALGAIPVVADKICPQSIFVPFYIFPNFIFISHIDLKIIKIFHARFLTFRFDLSLFWRRVEQEERQMETWQKRDFSIADEGPYEGFHNPQVNWNGFACPYLTKDGAAKLFAKIQSDPKNIIKFHEDRDCYEIQFEQDESSDLWAGLDILVDGERIHVYPIGYYCWTWQTFGDEVKDVQVDSDPDKEDKKKKVA